MNHRSTTMYLRRVLAGRSPITESESLSPEDRAERPWFLGFAESRAWSRRDFVSDSDSKSMRL